MINQKSVMAVDRSHFSKTFCRPLYETYCFSNIPKTIERLLTGKGSGALPKDAVGGRFQTYDKVVVFLIDGFGWRFFEKYADKYPFLKRFQNEGIASKITSLFPSTTANHITCMNTGMSACTSGIYEWFYYDPMLDRMIAPLLFSFAGDKQGNTIKQTGVLPSQIFPKHTLYQDFKKKKIESFVLNQTAIIQSPYSQTLSAGSVAVPFNSFSEGLDLLVKLVNKTLPHSAYYFMYFPDIDSAGHRHGIDSVEFEKAIENCWTMVEQLFWKNIAKGSKKTAYIFTADHGMAPVDPKTTVYLNQEIPEIEKYFKKNKEGNPLVPAGSCRDFFLHIEDHLLDEMHEVLNKHLQKNAEVYKTASLIDQKLFGNETPSDEFLKRVGNLVILPFENQAVWWYEKHRFEQHFYAAHGGLAKSEMESIFLFLEN